MEKNTNFQAEITIWKTDVQCDKPGLSCYLYTLLRSVVLLLGSIFGLLIFIYYIKETKLPVSYIQLQILSFDIIMKCVDIHKICLIQHFLNN